MNKRRLKKPWMILSAVLIVSSISAVAGSTAYASQSYVSQSATQYSQELQSAQNYLATAKKTNADTDIKKAIDSIVQLPYSGTNPDAKQQLVTQLVTYFNSMPNQTTEAGDVTYLANEAVNQVKNSMLLSDYDIANSIVLALPQGNFRTQLATTLSGVQDQLTKNIDTSVLRPTGANETGQTAPLDFSNLPSSAFSSYQNDNTGNYLPGYGTGSTGSTGSTTGSSGTSGSSTSTNPKGSTGSTGSSGTTGASSSSSPVVIPTESYTQTTDYVEQNGTCYQLVTKTVQGQKPVTTKTPAPKAYVVFCSNDPLPNASSTENYDFSKVKPAPPQANYGSTPSSAPSNNSSSGSNPSGNNGTTKQTPTINLFYTLDNTKKTPQYYDSGFAVSNQSTITYTDEHNLLYQIALETGGKTVDSGKQLLALIDHQIVVIDKTSHPISLSDVNKLLSRFHIQVKGSINQ